MSRGLGISSVGIGAGIGRGGGAWAGVWEWVGVCVGAVGGGVGVLVWDAGAISGLGEGGELK
ncbi:MAG: hypothetical protein NZ874_01305 [Fimbriimonadales bacterium]|nr:hypothetical protein [Fimbriimonadales bacterium]